MPIPAYTLAGILPAYDIDSNGHVVVASPYIATTQEFVTRFGYDSNRQQILQRWLAHRSDLRAIGIAGFQWLNGSFVENKPPKDIDTVTFFDRPSSMTIPQLATVVAQNASLLTPAGVKAKYGIDAFFVDLRDNPISLMGWTKYWYGLFSHQRITFRWKGMIEVPLTANKSEDLVIYPPTTKITPRP